MTDSSSTLMDRLKAKSVIALHYGQTSMMSVTHGVLQFLPSSTPMGRISLAATWNSSD